METGPYRFHPEFKSERGLTVKDIHELTDFGDGMKANRRVGVNWNLCLANDWQRVSWDLLARKNVKPSRIPRIQKLGKEHLRRPLDRDDDLKAKISFKMPVYEQKKESTMLYIKLKLCRWCLPWLERFIRQVDSEDLIGVFRD